jgi:precorrin-2 dehydrogenase / sirohydrochlorin ferrochelatase
LAKYYPICLNLSGRLCLVVGGGAVALRKTQDLLEAGAKVRAVAPQIAEGFRATCGVELVRRAYTSADLDGCVVAIAATDDAKINRRVYEDARGRGVLVNVVDKPEMCDFIVPATVRRGDMTISISTGGASPSLAKKIRRDIQKRYPARYTAYINILNDARTAVKATFAPGKRKAVLEKIARETLSAFEKKGVAAAKNVTKKIIRNARNG